MIVMEARVAAENFKIDYRTLRISSKKPTLELSDTTTPKID